MQLVSTYNKSELKGVIPVTLSVLEGKKINAFLADLDQPFTVDDFIHVMESGGIRGDFGFLKDIARLEFFIREIEESQEAVDEVRSVKINPTLHIFESSWTGIPEFMRTMDPALLSPADHPEIIILYKSSASGSVNVRTASHAELLALKIIAEEIDPGELGKDQGISLKAVEDLIANAADSGIILKPSSMIIRDPNRFPRGKNIDGEFFSSDFFTLQWHITQACDLKCRHCYDRTDRPAVDLHRGIAIIEELRRFCDSMNVRGQISFTGGNPLLHPDFFHFYEAGKEKGLYMAILGNPATRDDIKRIIDIDMPEFYQVSLEGLERHNDHIRGAGHFMRTMEFLEILKDLGVYSMVMLTLIKDNIDQVLSLAEALRHRADRFTFNRLALFGEGAGLSLPDKKAYRTFLEEYLKAAESNPILGIKDNLINSIKIKKGLEPFGGCAGYGCGAAFNFVSLLSDGEVHACRKMPSLIGNLYRSSMAEIYSSHEAERYRMGASACARCSIRPVCGGCPAVTMSHGLDIFTEKDPMCFNDG